MLFVKMLWTLRRLFIYLFYRKYFCFILKWFCSTLCVVNTYMAVKFKTPPLSGPYLLLWIIFGSLPHHSFYSVQNNWMWSFPTSLSRSLPPALFQEQYFPISSLSVFFFLSRVQRTGVELNRKIAICHLTCAREKKDKNWHRSLLLSQTGTLRGPSAL